MKVNKPTKFSTETLRAATKIGKITIAMKFNIGDARSNIELFGDMLFFMLSNGPDVCILRCTKYAYFIEYYKDAHRGMNGVDYFMVKNVRDFLFYLRRNNFIDFDTWDKKIQDSLDLGDIPDRMMDDDDYVGN